MRTWLPLLLCLCALVFGAGDAEAQVKRTKKKPQKKTGSQLRDDLSALRRRKDELRRQLAKTRKETKAVQGDIYVLDARLERLEDQLNETTVSLSKGRREQGRLEDELEGATARVANVRRQVGKRLKYMYVHQGESVLSAFVGTRSVGEIASRKTLMTAIAKKDRELFNDYRELQAIIRERKQRQDRLVVQIRGLRNRQIDQQAHLEVTKEDKRDALQELRGKQDQIKGLIAQLESDEANVYAQIRAWEAAQRRRRKPGQPPPPAFTGRFLKPARGRISSGFGMRFHPILRYNRLHAGIDIAAGSGSPIYAAAAGEVITAQYSRSYGNMVVIDHGGGVSTLYAHGSRLYVRTGQVVKQGQVIAAVGSTGLASGPHLHWEVRVNGRPVNPSSRL